MATIYLRKSTFYAQWYRPDGTRVARSTGCQKKREASRIAAHMEAEDNRALGDTNDLSRAYRRLLERANHLAENGKLNAREAESIMAEIRQTANPDYRMPTLAEALRNWLSYQQDKVSQKTFSNFRTSVNTLISAFGPAANDSLDSLTREQIEKTIKKLNDGKRKATTINLHVYPLRATLKRAVQDEIIGKNPSENVPQLRASDSVPRAPFTPAEVRALIDHEKTPDEWKSMIQVAAHTGLRLMDVARLTRSHVDGSRLVIRPQKTSRTGKTLSIPLSPACIGAISLCPPDGYLFPRSAHQSAPVLSMRFRRIMERAGVAHHVTLPGGIDCSRSFHSLRHSFVSWLAEADIHSDVRQKLSGHSSTAIHSLYTHHDESLSRAVAALPEL